MVNWEVIPHNVNFDTIYIILLQKDSNSLQKHD